jgi:hypothetical protein
LACPPSRTIATTEPKFDYPIHPFSEELCKLLSDIPPGFSDLALNRYLSTQTIRLLHRVTRVVEKGPDAWGPIVNENVLQFTTYPQATSLEKAIFKLTIAFGLCFCAKLPPMRYHNHPRLFETAQAQLLPLLDLIVGTLGELVGPGFVVWAVYLTTYAHGKSGLTPVDDEGKWLTTQVEILARLPRSMSMLSFQEVQHIMNQYFWHKSLDPGLTSLWRHHQNSLLAAGY